MDRPRIYNAATDIVPPGAVLVDRNTIYGNPYRIGPDGDLAQVTALYVNYLLDNPLLVEDIKTTLRGNDLVCWCWPERCHAELLLILANDTDFKLDAML
jgi:hypothetical protein